jgi:hypothetical protein
MMPRAKQVLLMITLSICFMAMPVFAQEAGSTAPAASTSDPIGTMTILVGLGLILVVGGRLYMKEHANKEVD